MMTREEHLKWCKDRALDYARQGDLTNAFASFQSDMGKHEGTRTHMGLELGAMLLLSGDLDTVKEMTKWLNGFN